MSLLHEPLGIGGDLLTRFGRPFAQGVGPEIGGCQRIKRADHIDLALGGVDQFVEARQVHLGFFDAIRSAARFGLGTFAGRLSQCVFPLLASRGKCGFGFLDVRFELALAFGVRSLTTTRVMPSAASVSNGASAEPIVNTVMGDDGIEFQLDRVRSFVSIQSIVAGNVFQLRGDKWQLSFGGETKYLKDSVGLHYIARLLREPRRIIPVPILHEMVTGVPAGVLKGSSEPYFTTEAFQNYRDRLEQLREDRIKAEQHSDSSWLTRIDKEVEQIEIELGYNLGLNNSIRERSEYIKVKCKIAEYIRRGETAVSKRHSSLGLHLHNTIKKKGGFRYEPEHDFDWVT